MGVDLGGGDVGVTEQFLDGAEVVVVGEKMGGEAMAQGVGRGGLGDAGGVDGFFHGPLDEVIALMVAADGVAARVGGELGRRKDPEPGPLFAGIGVFGVETARQVNSGD